MKRELFIHYTFWFSFFVFITLIKRYFNLSYWPFWLGGIVGTLLPDIDHFLYVYVSGSQDLSSQRIDHLVKEKQLGRSIELLYETRNERRGLVFHSVLFQAIFFILTFWMLTSSGSLLGKGLVLAFALHISIDQLIDLTEIKSLETWFKNLPFKLDYGNSKIYWIITTSLNLLMGFFL